jgi:hypothetical protein
MRLINEVHGVVAAAAAQFQNVAHGKSTPS